MRVYDFWTCYDLSCSVKKVNFLASKNLSNYLLEDIKTCSNGLRLMGT